MKFAFFSRFREYSCFFRNGSNPSSARKSLWHKELHRGPLNLQIRTPPVRRGHVFARTRTENPLIKSQLLYQLSYEGSSPDFFIMRLVRQSFAFRIRCFSSISSRVE